VIFQALFPAGERGDAARVLLPEAIRRSHDRLCTVSRTVELGTPIHIRPAAPGQSQGEPDSGKS
jgi:putative redox protein